MRQKCDFSLFCKLCDIIHDSQQITYTSLREPDSHSEIMLQSNF